MNILRLINEHITSPALAFAVTVFGAFFAVRLGVYSPKKTLKRIRELKIRGDNGISPLSSLSVALAGTLGVGNIAGVAVAISTGGAGAVFWMMVSAVSGAALKYCEAYLSVRFRKPGTRTGGAPYYAEKIAGRGAGAAYAVLCVVMSFFSGTLIQTGAAVSALKTACGAPPLVVGFAFAAVCLVTAAGGMERVSSFTSAAMPVFCAVFAAASVIAVSMRINEIPGVLDRIFSEAFGFSQITGGFSGALLSSALRQGMTKGVFSHEAGCGTSSFSHAASDVGSPSAQGLIGIAEVLADTLFFGGLTALVILLSPAGSVSGSYDGAELSIAAYSYFFGGSAVRLLTVLTVFFAFATVLCWGCYGASAVRYLSGGKLCMPYLIIYCSSLVLGAVIPQTAAWHLSDITSSLMLLLNCFCLIKGRKEMK